MESTPPRAALSLTCAGRSMGSSAYHGAVHHSGKRWAFRGKTNMFHAMVVTPG